MVQRPEQQEAATSFSDVAVAQLQRLRSVFAELIGSMGADLTATAVARTLKVDGKLAWRIVRLSRAPDAVAAAEHLPGEDGVRIFLHAARSRGLRADLVDAAERATRDYLELEAAYAGDRATLSAMLAGLRSGSEEAQRLELQQRRELYSAISRVWGIRCRVQYGASFVHPTCRADLPGYEDFATLRGYLGLVRLRDTLSWPLPRARVTDERLISDGRDWRPIDPASGATHGAPLLRAFCSETLPTLRQQTASGAPIVDKFMMADWSVGVQAPVDLVLAETIDAAAKSWTDSPNHAGEAFIRNYTPCELLVMDHFVHRAMLGRLQPTLRVLLDVGAWPPYPMQSEARSEHPCSERVESLGAGLDAAGLAEIPRYRDMLRTVCEARGWNPQDFDVYRVRLAYPPVPSIVSMRYHMPSLSPARV
jgi:hypothetical protein